MVDVNAIERRRLVEQVRLDSLKTPEKRNELGQFATPPALAIDILQFAKTLWTDKTKVRFLDPAIGTGSFYSALLNVFGRDPIDYADGFEVDPAFAEAAKSLWGESDLAVGLNDFTTLDPQQQRKYNLIVSNPPYVRHHHMSADYKTGLQETVVQRLGIRTSGLAGLYSFFLLLCDSWLEPDGLSLWLIPSEFMDVNYGEAVREYLTTKVQLLQIHRFCPSDVQFTDALVSSAIVVFRKAKAKADGLVEMSFGGPLLDPAKSAHVTLETLKAARKWSGFPSAQAKGSNGHKQVCLGDLFHIKRGLATGSNEFFILSIEQADEVGIPNEFRRPILPGPRFVQQDVIEGDADGYPIITPRLVLIDCPLSEDEIKARHPAFWRYLDKGKEAGIDATYLASRRMPWYSQEKRPPAPFLSTYMGRTRNGKKPFRVIWNKSGATAHNVYLLLYPKLDLAAALSREPSLSSVVFEHLQSIEGDTFVGEGRVYGGGLHKMEPKEMERVPLEKLADVLTASGAYRGQASLF